MYCSHSLVRALVDTADKKKSSLQKQKAKKKTSNYVEGNTEQKVILVVVLRFNYKHINICSSTRIFVE